MAFHSQYKSIRNKFSLAIVSACFAVLLLISLLFVGVEFVSTRREALSDLQSLAAILSQNLTAPLLNNKRFDAKNILAALEAAPHIQAAYLFDPNNKPIAQYLDSDSAQFVQKAINEVFPGQFPESWRQAAEPQTHFALDFTSLYSPIIYQGSPIGGIYLLSDFRIFEERLFWLFFAALLASASTFAVAWLLAGWMQKPISEPIIQLAETVQLITSTGDYHLRSEKYAEDEVGQLVDGFNSMLSQLEIRDHEIEAHQQYLEQTVRDRTADLTKTIADLALAREQAESANQAKSTFLANMTHELRTPLVGVLGMNELLIESSLGQQQRSLAESVQRSGQDLLELINDILDFSKIEGGHLKLEQTNIDLLILVEDTISMLAGRAYDKGIELICSVEPDAAWEVAADAQRLKQILLNLLGNAIKFTHQGHVGLRLTRRENKNFLFEVYDTGIGVDRQKQASVFEAFSQVDESTSRLFGGTGLGLSIVHDLTRMMNGSLNLESEPGQGSSFQVELPLQAVRPTLVRFAAEDERSVILFEPHLQARESLLTRLLDLGFAAEAVSSAQELLSRLTINENDGAGFDLMILPDCCPGTVCELLPQIEGFSGTIICQQKNITDALQTTSVKAFPKPLLWDALLRNDLLQKERIDKAPLLALQPEPVVALPVSEPAVKGRILIVDDNASTRELIGFSLAASGWQGDDACNAEEALAAVAGQRYQLILMDVNMPGTDGLEVTRILRRRGVETPIYALTAHGDAKVFEACNQAGMQGSLRKPFRQKELFALLEKNSLLTGEQGEAGVARS